MTDPLGQSQVLPYLVGLSKGGYKITLLSFEKPDRYKEHREKIESICTDNNIDWYPETYSSNIPVLAPIYNVMKMIRKAKALHHIKQFNIIHCRSYLSALVGQYMKKKYGTKFLFDMRGFWADERVDGGLWNLSNPVYRRIYKYIKKKEVQFINEADAIVSLTQCAVDEIHTWKNIIHQPVPIQVIPCCADLKLFNPSSSSAKERDILKHELGISNSDFIISYIGSLGTWYMLNEMLDFFKTLLSKKPNTKFLFITNDPGDYIKKKALHKNIPLDAIIITSTTRNKMPLYISISNYNLFFVLPSYSKKASSPVKMGEAMGMGVPLICNNGVGDVSSILNDTKSGYSIDHFSLDEYERVVELIFKNEIKQEDILNGAVKYYSLEKGIEKYISVYNSLK